MIVEIGVVSVKPNVDRPAPRRHGESASELLLKGGLRFAAERGFGAA
jgi:hypothetical protein